MKMNSGVIPRCIPPAIGPTTGPMSGPEINDEIQLHEVSYEHAPRL